MKLLNLPEKDQEPKPKSDEINPAGEQSKRKPKLVVYRGTITPRPGENSQPLDAAVDEKPASQAAAGSRARADSVPTPDATNIPPEASHQTESPSAHAFRKSEAGNILPANRDSNPGRRLHAFEEASKKAPRAKLPWRFRLRPTRERAHRAYWDVAATISLIVNVVLAVLLIIMAGQIKTLRTSVNTTVNNLLGGLYGNFVKMDQASINTTIQVNAQIPLNFNLPVSQNTQVVLTGDVSIPRAHVVINTGGLNINAQANVTLPAGTTLPIALNLDIPVQSSIPISLQVPVSIPMYQTELHEPFTGLQTSLRPLYCLFNKNAQYPEGMYICAEHETPTPGTP
jgi:hypothetical protein